MLFLLNHQQQLSSDELKHCHLHSELMPRVNKKIRFLKPTHVQCLIWQDP